MRRTEPTEHQRALLGRMDTRKWVESEIVDFRFRIKELAGEIKFIRHARNCERCLVELQLDVERYMGSRLLWYLNLQNEEYMFEDPRFSDRPKLENYRIGSYWTGCSDDTVRFIKDRMNWAEKITIKQLVAAVQYLKLLMSWNFDWEPIFLGCYDGKGAESIQNPRQGMLPQ